MYNIHGLQLGTCIKDMNREVSFQNELCKKKCGDMMGQICTKGCMSSYFPLPGMSIMKNSVVDENIVDAVVINDGHTLTTLLYDANEKENEKEIEKESALEIAKLSGLGLSKSEIVIFMKVLEGKSNTQIIKDLFISKSTIKTHLNNIYKKLPANYQLLKNRR